MRIVVLGNPKLMWLAWKTQPDESLGGTVRGLLHGKLQGGSSAINGLMRARGNPATTTTGRKRERLGWNYASLLPYFNNSDHDPRGETDFRAARELRPVVRHDRLRQAGGRVQPVENTRDAQAEQRAVDFMATHLLVKSSTMFSVRKLRP